MRRWHRGLAGKAFGLLLASACSSQSGSSSLTADGGRATGGDAGRDAGREAGRVIPRDVWTDMRADAAALICDAEASSSTDAADATVLVDAGTPPPDCIAPCIWELVKKCLPTAACTTQDYGSGKSLACSPATDWWDVIHVWAPGSGSGPAFEFGSRHEVFSAGQLCFGVSISMSDGVSASTGSWWNANGETVAKVIFSSNGWGPVLCGPSAALDALPYCSGTIGCGDGVTSYDVIPTAPHCAPWLAAAKAAYGLSNCTPGCCPSDPPAVPL